MDYTSKIAIIPGRFQPITLGHMKVIRMACNENDFVYIVVVGKNGEKPSEKNPIPLEKRVEMIKKCVAGSNVEVMTYPLANLDIIGDEIAQKRDLSQSKGISLISIYAGTDRGIYETQLKYFNGFDKDGIDKTKGKDKIFRAEIVEVKRDEMDISATQVRNILYKYAINKENKNDKIEFDKLTPVQIHGDIDELSRYILKAFPQNESILVRMYNELME